MATERKGLKERNRYRLKKILVIGILAGMILGMAVKQLDAGRQIDRAKEAVADTQKVLEKENKELKDKLKQAEQDQSAEMTASQLSGKKMWNLALVNYEHPLDREYLPELKEIAPEQAVDARIYDAVLEMFEAGGAEGLKFYVASAYRSYEKQRDVYNETMDKWIAQGMRPLDAYEETAKSVAVPGTSEHATGLALDITSGEYMELDEQQAETAEFKWLKENCWKYGFILRYPPEKSDITKIIYEPWHFRYVGKEAAKEIFEQDVTLEEYLNEK